MLSGTIQHAQLLVTLFLGGDGVGFSDYHRVTLATQAVEKHILDIIRTRTCRLPLLFFRHGGFLKLLPSLLTSGLQLHH